MVRRRKITPVTTASTAILRKVQKQSRPHFRSEPETESPVVITYQELYKRVMSCRDVPRFRKI